MLAAKGGHAAVVKLLLESGASVWLQTDDKRTALHKVGRYCYQMPLHAHLLLL
jgi:ankyrin repeat protein